MHARCRCRHPDIAFVLDQNHRAAFGDQEVGAADSHVGGQEFLPQDQAGNLRQLFRLLGPLDAQLIDEQIGDVPARFVQGRRDDMIRPLPRKLHDVFAQVRFHRLDVVPLQSLVQVDFFAHHRLRLHRQLDAVLAPDRDHCFHSGLGISAPNDVSAALLNARLQHLEVIIEVVERMLLEAAGVVAQLLILG